MAPDPKIATPREPDMGDVAPIARVVGPRVEAAEMTGFRLLPARLDAEEQNALVAEVMAAIDAAPLYRPVTPGGKAMSVRMTNLGPLGWVTDAKGYRYEKSHPVTGALWPAIPPILLALWADLAGPAVPPDACLVNLYDADARMGLHQDNDEADFGLPVVSVSLGDTAVFPDRRIAAQGPDAVCEAGVRRRLRPGR